MALFPWLNQLGLELPMIDRVKGSLKVTRAFGAGFLKQPKWNNALLEAFQIDYVGTSPYITCFPYLHHHRLGPKDRFLILSSDGLYQYFTNEEAVSEVELFITLQPEGDRSQMLTEQTPCFKCKLPCISWAKFDLTGKGKNYAFPHLQS